MLRPSTLLPVRLISLLRNTVAVLVAILIAPFGLTLLCAAPALAQQQVLKVTTIPEEAATEQMRKFGPLTKYLERTLGVKVEFTPVNDYASPRRGS